MAQVLAAQTQDKDLQAHFAPLANALADNEQKTVEELKVFQGQPADIGGCFLPNAAKTAALMRPSTSFNAALEAASA